MIRTTDWPGISGLFENGDHEGDFEVGCPVEGIGKKLKKVGKRAGKLVKKALPVAAVVASVIPGVGPAVGAALGAAAVAAKKQQQRKRAKRASQAAAAGEAFAPGDPSAAGDPSMLSAQVLPGGTVPVWGDSTQPLPDGGDEPTGGIQPAPASGGVLSFFKSPAGMALGGAAVLGLLFLSRR